MTLFAVVIDFPVYSGGKIVSRIRCVDSRGDWVSCCQRANWVQHRSAPAGVIRWQESFRDLLPLLSDVILDATVNDRPLKDVDLLLGIRNRLPAN